MSKRLVHTPEGVRDIYGAEFARKLQVQEMLHCKIREYGYQDIQTPTFEFFDVFSREIGTTPSRELYKLFDKEGNTLVLRPDFTPSIARCAAKYFMDEELPIRFCYVGNTFTNISDLQGKLKETTQMGAELVGDGSVEADGEMISLVIDSLLNSGLRDFQISIGQVEYFKGICEETGLDEETELMLRDFISNKNYFGAEDLLITRGLRPEDRHSLLKVTDMTGSIECLEEARRMIHNERSHRAIDHLKLLYECLREYGIEKYISFDLGMLSRYKYYTGVIFKAYTYGAGDAIVKGGRYDSLLSRFGKDAPAIGFMVIVDDLLAALSRQKTTAAPKGEKVMLVYEKNAWKKALDQAKEYRRNGIPAELVQKREDKSEQDYIKFASNNMTGEVIFLTENSAVNSADMRI